MSSPLISIVMPVYNCEDYVSEAIRSILQQTYKNFEFVVINDGSTDNTSEIIKSFHDSRITYLDYIENKGNYPRRNEGCKIARGKYIAVMDADDYAFPDRLEIQVDTLEYDSELLVCGTAYQDFSGIPSYRNTNPELLKINLIFNNCFLHPSLLIRKEIIQNVNYYNEEYYYASDYDLMCKIALCGKIENLPDILMKYRTHRNQISCLYLQKQKEYADKIRKKYLENAGFRLDENEIYILTHFMNLATDTKITKKEIYNLIENITCQNSNIKVFNKNILERFLYSMVETYLH